MRVNIAPLCPTMVHTQAVTLDMPARVNKGQARALAPEVGQGRGSLLQGLGADQGHAKDEG